MWEATDQGSPHPPPLINLKNVKESFNYEQNSTRIESDLVEVQWHNFLFNL